MEVTNSNPTVKVVHVNESITKFLILEDPNKSPVLQIIQDYILWVRVNEGIFQAINAHLSESLDQIENKNESLYNGLETAFLIMGADEMLKGELFEIGFNIINEDDKLSFTSRASHITIAKRIYDSWVVYLKKCATETVTTRFIGGKA